METGYGRDSSIAVVNLTSKGTYNGFSNDQTPSGESKKEIRFAISLPKVKPDQVIAAYGDDVHLKKHTAIDDYTGVQDGTMFAISN